MVKERDIQLIKKGRERAQHILDQRTVLKGKLWEDGMEQNRSTRKVVQLGRIRKKVDTSISGLETQISAYDRRLTSYDEAVRYRIILEQRTKEIIEMEALVAQGYISSEALDLHRKNFERLKEEPEKSMSLRAGLRLLDEERKKQETVLFDAGSVNEDIDDESKAEAKAEDEAAIKKVQYQLPDGRTVTGIAAEILQLGQNSSEVCYVDVITACEAIYGENNPQNHRKLRTWLSLLEKQQLPKSGIELTKVYDENGRKQIKGYYIKEIKLEEEDIPQEEKRKTTYEITDGKEITGKLARVIDVLLMCDDPECAITRDELEEMVYGDSLRERSRSAIYNLISRAKDVFKSVGIELSTISDPKERFKGDKAKYYLKPLEFAEEKIAKKEDADIDFPDADVPSKDLGNTMIDRIVARDSKFLERIDEMVIDILDIDELGTDYMSPALVTKIYPAIKQRFIEEMRDSGYIGEGRGKVKLIGLTQSDIVVLLYLHKYDEGRLDKRMKRKLKRIVEERISEKKEEKANASFK